MNILIASSREHVKYFLVMLESLYENNKHEQIDVYVIYEEKDDFNWNSLESQASRYQNKIIRIPVEERKFSRFPRVSIHWPRLLYFKLLAAELLPENLDRVLLLESDMIILKPLNALYYTGFDGNHIIACENLSNYWGNIEHYHGKKQFRLKKNLGIPNEYNLFGGGVLVLNLKKFRDDRIGYQKVCQLAEKFQYTWSSPEESLFWALFYDSWKEADPFSFYLLPLYWKRKPGRLEDMTDSYGSVIHYSICNKPWDHYVLDTECELDHVWWAYAEKTEFYDEMLERFDRRLRERKDYKEAKQTLANVDLYYQTLIRWKYIIDVRGPNALAMYFREKGYSKIAVYGPNPLQMLLCTEIQRSDNLSVAYLIDTYESRKKGEFEIKRASDCSFEDVDVIVVTAFLHFKSIRDNVKHSGLPIVSLQDIIENLLPDSFNQHVQ